VKPSIIIAVDVHPQLSHNGHPVDGGAGSSCLLILATRT